MLPGRETVFGANAVLEIVCGIWTQNVAKAMTPALELLQYQLTLKLECECFDRFTGLPNRVQWVSLDHLIDVPSQDVTAENGTRSPFMKRIGLNLVIVGSVLFTGFVLNRAGWFSPHGSTASSRRLELRAQTKLQESSLSQASMRWRQCQPTHWRYLMLQR